MWLKGSADFVHGLPKANDGTTTNAVNANAASATAPGRLDMPDAKSNQTRAEKASKAAHASFCAK